MGPPPRKSGFRIHTHLKSSLLPSTSHLTLQTKLTHRMQSNPKQSMGFPPPQRSEPLPCPRCDSTATKFCYYNNYNLSQPRYLCKSCRRYWTHGGTLRNVPVGGATRKISKKPRTSSSSSSSSSSSCSVPSTTARPAMSAPADHHVHTNTPVLSSLGLTEFPYMGLDDAASEGVGVFADFSGSGSALLGSSSDSDYNNAWDDELAWPTLAISTPHHPPENLD